ncbi:MAG: branched-chain amino acid ABC transporter permease, partial [Pseudonocardia sp.]|nr:branched-chain amino acid ABC transporter permease [Pseudonocardia sp.]
MTTTAAPAVRYRVRRSGSRIGSAGYLVVLAVLALVPVLFVANVVQQLTSFLILVILAAMWNALAGYGGLVSVGLQAYIGFGAYAVIFLTQRGMPAYAAVVVAAVASGALALVISPLLLRLRGGQFAIGTWVVAEALALVIVLDTSLGGGSGVSLRELGGFSAADRRAYTYWLSLAFAVVALGAVLVLLRR